MALVRPLPRGIEVPPHLSRQPNLARGLVFRYHSLRASRVAWTIAGQVFGVPKSNTALVATDVGFGWNDEGDNAGGFYWPRIQDWGGGVLHPAQTVGTPVSMELIWNLDAYGSNNAIASTSNHSGTYNGCTVRTGAGDIQVNLGDGTGTSSGDRRTWEFNNTTLNTGETYHFIFTIRDPTLLAGGEFFLNGHEETPSNFSGGTGSPNTPRSANGIQILGQCEGGGGAADGRVMMMNVWDRQLTRAEMLARFNDPLGIFEAPLLTSPAGVVVPPGGTTGNNPVIIAITT